MKSTDIPRIREWFEKYTETFLTDDEIYNANIRLKIEHSYRVLDRMTEITDDLQLKGRRRRIALACALLHDAGRFEQFKQYRTFSDMRSANHGELGKWVIEEHNVLSELSPNAVEIIVTAVQYHNAKRLPDELNAEQRFYAELTRDADKIDIYKVINEYYYDTNPDKDPVMVHNLPELPDISEAVFDEYMDDGHVSAANLKSVADFKVFQIGWVWDINTRAALRILNKLGYVERMIALLPDTEKGRAVAEKYHQFINILDDEKKLSWTELSREKMQDCRIFSLYSSKRESFEGKISTAYTLEAPDWVTVVPLIKKNGEDYFVMVRQYRHGSMRITTEFPAGTLEPDEEPEIAAVRELQEETGYNAGKITYLGSVNPNPAFLTNTYTAYLAEDLVQTGSQNLDEHEYVDYELIPVDDVIKTDGQR